MSRNLPIDSLLDAVVDQIADELVPAAGGSLSTTKPVYDVRRYMGGEFDSAEGLQRGMAGRTPAVRVRFAGTRSLKTTIGRRYDRVESTLSVIVASDSQRTRDDRENLLAIAESVRTLVGARRYGLEISPLRYVGTDVLRDSDQLTALAVKFSTRHRADYTIDPGTDTMDTATGAIYAGDSAILPTLTVAGTAGTTAYSYRVDGIDADGARFEGIAARVTTGPATLSGSNYITIDWEASDLYASYEIVRTEADGTPATTGTIGATSSLTFNDTGLATSSALLPEPYTQEVEVDLT